MKKILFLASALLGLVANAQTVYYVKEGGTGHGTSWSDAAGDLQGVINAAKEGDQIWVAKGTYYPTHKANNLTILSLKNRDNAFVLKKNVSIYGGFAGTETDLNQRNWKQNATILSGDFNNDDVVKGVGYKLKITKNDENAYRVIISAGDVGTAKIDGFTVKGGYDDRGYDDRGYNNGHIITVNGETITYNRGAGMYNAKSSPTIQNMIFENNKVYNNTHFFSSSTSYGGAMYNEGASPTITNVVFQNNIAYSSSEKDSSSYGGAMYNKDASPTITNVVFQNNIAYSYAYYSYSYCNCYSYSRSYGGAMCNSGSSSPTITNVVFQNNIVQSVSGYVSYSYGGAMYSGRSSSPTITNAIFQGNKGGYAISYAAPENIKIYNSIILGNEINITGEGATSTIKNSLIEGVGPMYISNGNLGGTINQNLVFASTDPSSTENLRLKAGSPAINRGNNQYNTNASDLAGNARIADNTIDMGAYEYNSSPLSATEVLAKNTDVKVYPNPVDTMLNVATEEAGTAQLYSITGQLVKTANVVKGTNTINMENLQRGVYILKLGNKSVKVIKR